MVSSRFVTLNNYMVAIPKYITPAWASPLNKLPYISSCISSGHLKYISNIHLIWSDLSFPLPGFPHPRPNKLCPSQSSVSVKSSSSYWLVQAKTQEAVLDASLSLSHTLCQFHQQILPSLGLGRFPWRREWLPTPVFLLGEFHGQRSLAGYTPWGRKELDNIEQISHAYDLVASIFSDHLIEDWHPPIPTSMSSSSYFCSLFCLSSQHLSLAVILYILFVCLLSL